MAKVVFFLGGVCQESESMPLMDARPVAASLSVALGNVEIVEVKECY